MTPAEHAARRELEAVELAAEAAVLALEAARERFETVVRREARRERGRAGARAHLHVVRAVR
jgi:hypothetical protein